MEIKTKEYIDMNDAPPSELNNYLYNCTECSSNIEILSLDEHNIKFICHHKDNSHSIDIKIEEYLNKFKQYNSLQLNDDKCDIHKKEYLSYCFDCNIHLCEDCLKTKKHGYHCKINIIEVLPENEILVNISNLIEENKKKIEKLEKDEKEIENKLKIILKNNVAKIKVIKEKNREKNRDKKKRN